MKHEQYLACVENEPLLSGDPPEELWQILKVAVKKDDKEMATKIFNRVVTATKTGITKRMGRLKKIDEDKQYIKYV